ncbi:hypothetical protein KP509_19G036200 [Ceratopteris richardii]|uniref:Uncharacterized protein n=1 Tax=Ceratopteris richardii TaxID=49495 RepID=A0A8T2SJ80_CERRI|nr:hypothetical protein KP509_19G036200 [Ceratopteris richardii]
MKGFPFESSTPGRLNAFCSSSHSADRMSIIFQCMNTPAYVVLQYGQVLSIYVCKACARGCGNSCSGCRVSCTFSGVCSAWKEENKGNVLRVLSSLLMSKFPQNVGNFSRLSCTVFYL